MMANFLHLDYKIQEVQLPVFYDLVQELVQCHFHQSLSRYSERQRLNSRERNTDSTSQKEENQRLWPSLIHHTYQTHSRVAYLNNAELL